MTFRSGHLLILTMFGFGLAAALLGMWYRYDTTRRPLALWGPEAAALLVRAPRVTALEFDPPLPSGVPPAAESVAANRLPMIFLDPQTIEAQAARRQDATRARGILNVRQALVEDASFDWDTRPADREIAWRYALLCTDDERRAVALFDPAAKMLLSAETGVVVRLEPATAAGLEVFFREQFGQAVAK